MQSKYRLLVHAALWQTSTGMIKTRGKSLPLPFQGVGTELRRNTCSSLKILGEGHRMSNEVRCSWAGGKRARLVCLVTQSLRILHLFVYQLFAVLTTI
jgi:hypothetical protein